MTVFGTSLEHLTLWSPITCGSLNSNYIVYFKSFTKDEIISTKNLSITDVTKNSVTSKPLNNSKSLLSNQKNLGSNLHKVRIENPLRIIFGQININSIRNKFGLLMNIIKNEIDILMISETKIDNSFPISQFTMTGYSIPFSLIGQVMGWNTFICQRRYSLKNN